MVLCNHLGVIRGPSLQPRAREERTLPLHHADNQNKSAFLCQPRDLQSWLDTTHKELVREVARRSEGVRVREVRREQQVPQTGRNSLAS